MEVYYHPTAQAEVDALPEAEKIAMDHAVEKLEVLGAALPFPHASKVRGVPGLFELRPRAGRSPSRAFYRRMGGVMVIGAIGPEATVDRRGFRRAVTVAQARLKAVEEGRKA